jgi:GntR family transcriptional regulator
MASLPSPLPVRALRQTDVPLHHQIAHIVRMRVEAGDWGGERLLGTERELCEEFGVSRTTVRQALSKLKVEGLLQSRRGVGTRNIARAGKHRVVRSVGDPLHASVGSRPRVVTFGEVAAPKAVAGFFGIAPGSAVFQLVRVHDLEAVALSVVVSYLPAELGRRLRQSMLRKPMYELMWRRFGIRFKRSVHTLRVARADASVASLLGIGLADPVLRVQSSVYLEDGTPIRWTDNFFREDRYEYEAEMEWPDPRSQPFPAPSSNASAAPHPRGDENESSPPVCGPAHLRRG